MIKFKDLYVTLAAERSLTEEKPSGDKQVQPPYVFVVQPPAPPTTVASTACCVTHSLPIFVQVAGYPPDSQEKLLEYLTSALARPDVTTGNIQEPGDLQTMAEVNALERKFNSAMGELRVRKAQLQKTNTKAKAATNKS